VVIPLSAIQLRQKSSDVRISSGNAELDRMCGGGFFRDSVILVSGRDGDGQDADGDAVPGRRRGGRRALPAARLRGEPRPALPQRERLGHRLRADGAGRAAARGLRLSRGGGLEDWLIRIKAIVEEFRPNRVALDSLSALERGGSQGVPRVRDRPHLLHQAPGDHRPVHLDHALPDGRPSITESHISTLTDSIILLRYVETFGEMKRGLTVLKMRGSSARQGHPRVHDRRRRHAHGPPVPQRHRHPGRHAGARLARRRRADLVALRAAAEASAGRFRFLAEASALLSLPLEYTETLATLARLCAAEVADWAVIYVVGAEGVVERLEVAHRDPEKAEAVRALRDHPIQPAGPHPVLEVLRTRSPLLVTTIDEARLRSFAQDEPHLELLRRLGVESFMVVPLVARDREIGAIGLISSDPGRPFGEEDLAQANDLAFRAALAIDNARLYREAQEANQAKSDLLAVISHDLRTPLNSIIGHADLLALGIQEELSDGSLQWVGRIRMAAGHLLYLIDELLSFARIEAGREELRLDDVDAAAVARDVAAVVEPLAAERGLAFDLEVPDQPVALRTDPDRLRQVLLNLVGNAIKYTEAGEVRLELSGTAEGGATFRVRDTGIGIRAEHLGKIFEPFWQVDPGQRAKNGGTGLGLGVVRGLVRLLGGDVEVESEFGRGSTFTVRLPPDAGE
jgi:signal transduction histidine kinase